MKLLTIGRVIFAIVSGALIVVAGGGLNFLYRPIGVTYVALWIAYWLVQASRQRGKPSEYDKKQRVTYASGVVIIPALIIATPWEYAHFSGPIPRDGPSAWFGLLLFGLGIVLLATAMKTLGRFYTSYLEIQPNHDLVTTGLYRFVRHPGYLAEIMSMFGIGLSLSSLVGLAMAIVTVPLVLLRIKYEEKMLIDAFGDKYQAYKRRTRQLIPFIY